MVLTAKPYTQHEIEAFARERVSNVDQEIFVNYMPHDVDGRSRFFMERGRWNDYPHFMRITFDDLYNPHKEAELVEKIRAAGAKRAEAHAENDRTRTHTPTEEAIAYGRKCKEAAVHMHEHPEDFLRHARERFEHYGPAMEYAVRRGGDRAVKNFVKEVERLPPWMQVHVLEGDGLYLHSNSARRIESHMDGISWKLFGAGGQFNPCSGTDVTGRHLHAVDNTAIRDRATFLHEEGHHISHELVSKKALNREGDFAGLKCQTSRLPQWQKAVAERKLRFSPESIRLSVHLSSYPMELHAEEVFAETTRMYAEKYAKHGGDAAKVDKAMTRALPDIWPTYRDEILPECERQADVLYAARTSALRSAVAVKAHDTSEPPKGLSADAMAEARAAGGIVHGAAGGVAPAVDASHTTHAVPPPLHNVPPQLSAAQLPPAHVVGNTTSWTSRIKSAVRVLMH